jgi:hypothetical protein
MRKLESFMVGKMMIGLILLTRPGLDLVACASDAANNKTRQCAVIAVSYDSHLGFTCEHAGTPDTASRHIRMRCRINKTAVKLQKSNIMNTTLFLQGRADAVFRHQNGNAGNPDRH